jgi:hypothetical protein
MSAYMTVGEARAARHVLALDHRLSRLNSARFENGCSAGCSARCSADPATPRREAAVGAGLGTSGRVGLRQLRGPPKGICGAGRTSSLSDSEGNHRVRPPLRKTSPGHIKPPDLLMPEARNSGPSAFQRHDPGRTTPDPRATRRHPMHGHAHRLGQLHPEPRPRLTRFLQPNSRLQRTLPRQTRDLSPKASSRASRSWRRTTPTLPTSSPQPSNKKQPANSDGGCQRTSPPHPARSLLQPAPSSSHAMTSTAYSATSECRDRPTREQLR